MYFSIMEEKMDNQKLAELLFPDVTKTPEYYEEKYPYRKLPNKAEVTRLAPSPTGFIHLGNLYSALTDERLAHRNGGKFYLRIEDTDAKRTVEGAVDTVINVLRYFNIEFDEGAGFDDTDPRNAYGPYFQRQRVEIYHTYAKSLVERGLAYPCFCTEEELDKVRAKQEEDKVLTGYYGEYATCRNLSYEEIEANIKAGKPYVLRLRSQGSPDKEIVFFAIGFETTAPVHLMALKEAIRRGLPNFSILTSLFTVPPAIEAILSDPESKVDGFLTAGHVCAITGNRAYHRLTARYKIPMVVTGFEPVDLLYGIYRCVSQLEAGSYEVENAYKRAVPEQGNAAARQLMDEMLEPCDQDWRGIGIIPSSGLQLRSEYKRYSSRMRFQLCPEENQIASECIAGLIMRGLRHPSDCPHFGKACHPTHPLGAPMVSSEGVCAAYYRYK